MAEQAAAPSEWGGPLPPSDERLLEGLRRGLDYLAEQPDGYADAADIDRALGPVAVGALLMAGARGERVEILGGFQLVRRGRR